jgi:uncharacterized protein YkwD
MFSRRFPRTASLACVCQTLVLFSTFSLTAAPAFANGGKGSTKSAERQPERPVARMLSSTPTQVPPQMKARLVARISSSPSASNYAPASTNAVAVSTSSDERRAFDLVNAERQKRGLRPLILDGSLTRIARYHSTNMARVGILNHVDGDGLDLRGRAEVMGLRGWSALGENIAYNQGYSDPTAFAVERWMISEKHRENILSDEFTHAGIGIARAADGRVFFTEVFMKR